MKSKKATPRATAPKKKEASQKEQEETAHIPAFPVVAIGASAGGIEAISQLLTHLQPDLGMAYVIVQHLSPSYESILPALLQNRTVMKVHKVKDGIKVEPNQVYVIPPATYMSIVDGHLALSDRHKTDRQHRVIDYFLTSLAPVYQNNAIAIILSGVGIDGTEGIQAIKAHDGITFAQDDSALFQAMARHAYESGYIDFILSPQGIAKELASLSRQDYAIAPPGKIIEVNEREIKKIHLLLHSKCGVDFSQYKQTTINRRIIRRMALNRLKTLEEYTKLLRENNAEVELLYRDLLINVTNFFREPTLFATLTKKIFPVLFKNRKPDEPLRIWIPACASGEEACSMAIALFEYLGEKAITTPIQIFSTDLSESAIDKARTGIYSKNSVQHVSSQRLKQFFVKIDGSYQIIKPIRDICIFATHNLLKDPPFSRMDLISCQNVMIYLSSNAQKKILQAFHYALKPDSYLVLGKSETIGNDTDLFEPLDKEQKIYIKKAVSQHLNFDFFRRPTQPVIMPYVPQEKIGTSQRTDLDIEKETDKLLLSRYVPASVVVNKDLQILRFHGAIHNYLQPAAGKASLHLLKMVKDDLVFELRGLLHQARKEGHLVKKEGIHITDSSFNREINIEVLPVKSHAHPESYYLIVFRDGPLAAIGQKQTPNPKNNRTDSKDRRIHILEQELREAREHMKTMNEEFEATREELQSANEEVLSSNEELQSINEELETSKEEMQSTNEELITINEELQLRNNDLKESVDYTEAIVETIREPLVVLNKDLRIRTANKSFYNVFNLHDDIEGFYFYEIANNLLDVPALRDQLQNTVTKGIGFHDFELRHQFKELGEKILLFNAMRLSGEGNKRAKILLAIEDITERRLAEESLRRSAERHREAEERFQRIFNQATAGIVMANLNGQLTYFNQRYCDITGYSMPELLNKKVQDITHPDDQLLYNRLFLHLADTGTAFDIEKRYIRKDGTAVWVSNSVSAITDATGKPQASIAVVMDIMERKKAEEQLRESENRFRRVLEIETVGIIYFKPGGEITDANDAFLRMSGWSRQDLEAGKMRWDAMTPPEWMPQSEEAIREFMTLGRVTPYEKEYIRKDGSRWWALSAATRLASEEGVEFIIDISDAKHVEQGLRVSEERLRVAMQAGKMGTWDWNMQTDEILWSREHNLMYGITVERRAGTYEEFLEHIHPDDAPKVAHLLQTAIAEKEDFAAEMRAPHPDGKTIWIAGYGRAFYNKEGKAYRMIGVVIDITERKIMEKQKDEFIGIASHELKTPVTSIKSYIQLLHEILEEKQDQESVQLVGKLDKQIDRLTQLITDLLDVTKINEGQMQLHQDYFDPNALITEVAEQMQRTTAMHTIMLELQPVPFIIADRDRISQVLINLLSNAIKYSPDEKQIFIATKADQEKITVSIQDFGIGMSETTRMKVFDRFFRAHENTISTYPGLGLGLFIAADIVKRHGGEIWVESEKGKGTIFGFTIPIKKKNTPGQ